MDVENFKTGHSLRRMVIVTLSPGGRFSIGHTSPRYTCGVVCNFYDTFLPEHITVHVLRLLEKGERLNGVRYKLTADEDCAVARIFSKLRGEVRSDYRFSLELQKTYLVELIHFVTRLATAR